MNLKPRFLIKSGYYIVPSPSTALAKRKQEAQVERLTTQFKHANVILITNAVWWRGAALAVAASQSCVNDAAHAGVKTFLKSYKFFYHSTAS